MTIPSGVTSIGSWAFEDCRGIRSLTVPKSVKSIGDGAFAGCTGLTGITVPASVTTLPDSVFAGCLNLTSVKLAGNVTSIGSFAFSECSNLMNFTIPGTVKSVGMYAFNRCSTLTSMTVPDAVKTVEDGTFYNCFRMTRVTLPKSVTQIEYDAFMGTGLENVFYAGSESQWKGISISAGNNRLVNAKKYYNGKTIPEIVITAHPADVQGKNGEAVSLQVKATGSGLTYQWQLSDDGGKTWRDSSVKTARYDTTLTEKNHERQVRCVLTDSYGSKLITKIATMKINTLEITRQPVSVTVPYGAAVSFCVKAVGLNVKYQWQLSDDSGRTWRNSSVQTADYATTLTEKNAGRCVRCVVTDKDGRQLISDTASMNPDGVTITAQPSDSKVRFGGTVSFAVKATGGKLSYQWQLSDDAGKTWRNSSVKTANYQTTLSEKNIGRYVRCVVTNPGGATATSQAAVMRLDGVGITLQPADSKASIGGKVSFRVKAVGEGLIYQWQLSDDAGKTWRNSSVKIATYETTLTDKNNGRSVRCIVTDKYGHQAISKTGVMRVK